MASILIIDDEKSIRNVLKDILQHEGYQVEEAPDGEQGLKLFQSKPFDLVLCDIKMPKMDGMEVLQQIMAINTEIPVIMISGHGSIENAVEAVIKGNTFQNYFNSHTHIGNLGAPTSTPVVPSTPNHLSTVSKTR